MHFGYEVVEGSRAGTVLDNLEVTVYRCELSGDDACAPLSIVGTVDGVISEKGQLVDRIEGILLMRMGR